MCIHICYYVCTIQSNGVFYCIDVLMYILCAARAPIFEQIRYYHNYTAMQAL